MVQNNNDLAGNALPAGAEEMSKVQSLLFAPVLPWHQHIWYTLTTTNRLPHALCVYGAAGVGKHVFVWRLLAWLLCEHPHADHACGQCQSCQWLMSDTHPDVWKTMSIEDALDDLPPFLYDAPQQSFKDASSAQNKGKSIPKSSPVSVDIQYANTTPTPKQKSHHARLKVEDIRALNEFVQQGGHKKRLCLIDDAELMTQAAANALLKTLEEPSGGVYLLLICEHPQRLLPTIRSRVQMINSNSLHAEIAWQYLLAHADKLQLSLTSGGIVDASEQGVPDLAQDGYQQLQIAFALAERAPIQAMQLVLGKWFHLRGLWLTTLKALLTGKRDAMTASAYWQTQLPLTEFTTLTMVMLADVVRICSGIQTLQTDLSWEFLTDAPIRQRSEMVQSGLDALAQIEEMFIALQQNVQDRLAYDKLMTILARLC